MVCLYGQEGGLSQCEHFADKEGRGLIYTILYGRLLWTYFNLLIEDKFTKYVINLSRVPMKSMITAFGFSFPPM